MTLEELSLQIRSFTGMTHYEGRRLVGPVAPDLIDQALAMLPLLFEANIEPYRAVLGCDCTIGFFISDQYRHAEIELLSEGMVLEFGYRGQDPEIEEYGDPKLAILRLSEFFTDSKE